MGFTPIQLQELADGETTYLCIIAGLFTAFLLLGAFTIRFIQNENRE